MKKSITLLAIVAMLLVAIPSKAQIWWGIKAGLNNSTMSFHHHDYWDSSGRSGWFAGLTAKATIPHVGLGLDLSLLYDQREAKTYYETRDYDPWDPDSRYLKERAISIPINVRYDLDIGNAFGIFIAAGPEFAFNVGRKHLDFFEDSYWNMKSSRVNVNIGIGIILIRHLQVSANYSIACGHNGRVEDWRSDWDKYSPGKGRFDTWQVALAYYF